MGLFSGYLPFCMGGFEDYMGFGSTEFRIFRLVLDSLWFTLDSVWIFDGVKPSKGQDYGRSAFPYIYDRDHGRMKKYSVP